MTNWLLCTAGPGMLRGRVCKECEPTRTARLSAPILLVTILIPAGLLPQTFGTSSCMLMPIGLKPKSSESGLLCTVGFQLGAGEPVTFCYEGAAAVAGAGVNCTPLAFCLLSCPCRSYPCRRAQIVTQISKVGSGILPRCRLACLLPGLRDNLKIIPSGAAIGGDGEGLIDTVDSTRGLVFVPAFTGLFTPHYRDDARGMIIGLTQFHTKAHIALAMLEAVCFQAREVLDAMQSDAGLVLRELRVVSRSRATRSRQGLDPS